MKLTYQAWYPNYFPSLNWDTKNVNCKTKDFKAVIKHRVTASAAMQNGVFMCHNGYMTKLR